MARVEGDEVEVSGLWDGDAAFEVNDFIVRRVNGENVVDGTLLELSSPDVLDSTVIGYALRLSDGSMYSVPNPSPEMLNHIGARMWVHQSDDGMSTDFGIITE